MVRFGEVTALDGADLVAPEGAVTALIGPSGCGKSTLLRVVAGLQRPDRGSVSWQGTDITGIPPHRRHFGLMFQDFALFPHRSVAGNIAFGLEMERWSEPDIRSRVAEVLDLVGLDGYGSRPVDDLSGGEQQRVALARTLAPRPSLVMLDEPVASLDRSLRERLVDEMGEIFRSLGVTALYVTHDQGEAFAIADHLAVMDRGVVVRHGKPGAVWSDPGSEFVAGFLGHEAVLTVAVTDGVGRIGDIEVPLGIGDGTHRIVVPAVAVSLGPDRPDAGQRAAGQGTGTVERVTYQGGTHRIVVDVAGTRLTTETSGHPPPVGSGVIVTVDRDRLIPLP